MKTDHITNKFQPSRAGIVFASMHTAIGGRTDARRIKGFACLFFAALAFACGPIQAQAQFEEEFDDTEKPWQEIALQLPAAPVAENLLRFEPISATATQSFAVDGKSLTVGSDGVVRYTLVATSVSGAKTISYEGIRCHSFERKLYAFGQANGTWSRSQRDQWESMPRHATNNHHATLALEYFCDGRTIAGNANQLVHRLKWRQPISRGN